ncbi:MAG: hypothetical protein QW175_01155 [Candidatus Bathyarchaeia archaeon]
MDTTLPEEEKMACPWCGALFETKQQLGGHMGRCPKKPIVKEEAEIPGEEESKAEVEMGVQEKEERPSLARRPKEVEEILREVLGELWQLKPSFVNYVVRKSKQVGGIHPLELLNLLIKLDSGVKTKEEAQIIVDDYYTALIDAQREAEALGVRVSYPLGTRLREEDISSAVYGVRPGIPRYEREPYYGPILHGAQPPAASYEQVPGPYGQREVLTKEDVYAIIKEVLREKEEEENKRALEREVRSLREEVPKLLEEQISKVLSSIKPGISKEEVEHMLEDREKTAYLKYLEETSKQLREAVDRSIKALEEERARHEEERKELLEELRRREAQPVPSGEYTRDEIRLLADALRVAASKSVLKDAGKIVIEVLRPERLPPQYEKVEGEGGVEKYLPPELVKEE